MKINITFLTTFLCLILGGFSIKAQNPTFEWVKNIGGPGMEIGNDITTDSVGNVYLVGYFSLTADLDPGADTANFTSNGGLDIYIQKLDVDGNLLWVKQIGGIYDDYGLKIATDNNGNVYITGYFSETVDFDPGPGTYNLTAKKDYDIHILKLDTNGNFLWAKQIGGERNDFGKGIVTDNDGNVYITGFFRETVDFDPGSGVFNLTEVGKSDIFLLKLDTNGDFLWVKQIAGPESEFGNDLATDANGNIYMTGTFKDTTDFDPSEATFELTSTGNEDVFVLKMNENGNLIWVKQIGSVGPMDALGISVDANGNVYTIGTFMGTVDLNPGAGSRNLATLGGFDVFVQKLDTNGNYLWGHSMGGPGDDFGYSITNDGNGNAYIIGHFFKNASFGSGADLINLTAIGELDVFIQKFDANGNFGWLKQIGGTLNEYGYSITADDSGVLYSTGTFSGTTDFNLGGSDGSLTSNGNFDAFILKLSVETMGIEDSLFSNAVVAYPNPTTGDISVAFKSMQEMISVRLLSITGQVLLDKKFYNREKFSVELHQPSGVYILEVVDNNAQKSVMKIIKE